MGQHHSLGIPIVAVLLPYFPFQLLEFRYLALIWHVACHGFEGGVQEGGMRLGRQGDQRFIRQIV